MRKQLVFNLAFTSWHASVARGNHTDDRLARVYLEDPAFDVVIAEPYRSGPRRLARQILGERRPPLGAPPGGHASIFAPARLRADESTDVATVRREALRWSAGLRRHLEGAGLRRADVVLCNPFLAGFGDFTWARSATYLSTDDYATGEDLAPWREVLGMSYDSVARREMGVAAVAPVILERINPRGPRLLLPNAVDRHLWLEAAELPPAWFAQLPRPIAVYVGVLDGRIDPAALAAISRELSEGSVVLLGPETNDHTRQAAAALRNVTFGGAVRRDEVPRYLRSADVALIPHEDTAVTRGMSPLKIYEYLAAGLPVLATDLEPMRDIGDRVVLVSEPEGFGRAIRPAIALGLHSEHQRRAFVDGNSWTGRGALLAEFINGLG